MTDLLFWDEIRNKLKPLLAGHTFQNFVETLVPEDLGESAFRLNFPDRFCLENFQEKCLPLIPEIVKSIGKSPVHFELDVRASAPEAQANSVEIASKNPFDSKYSFENFIIGGSNEFAHAACQAVSKQPGQCYNPLFIFGGNGLGKTHLLKAIAHRIYQNGNHPRIIFLTSESFTNELIQAIRLDKMREFREKYRSGCDVLLLDDVHFLAGKERTQEEFFYTFNYLHESRKQIVLTSDRYPKDVEGLENRLQTRFEWGLVADIQPPEMETRIAILQNKAEEEHIEIPDDVARYIASHITTNIRELEGSLHRLQAYSSLCGAPISLELSQQILKDIAPKTPHQLTAEGILRLVALQFQIRISDIKSEKRLRRLTIPRQICMYLLRKHLLLSYPEIGRLLGGKDHTTVLHGVNKISTLLKADTEILKATTAIESLIR